MATNISVLSSSAWTVGGKFFERAFSLIVYIMLARLLSVEQFGVVAFSLLFLEFITVLINSGVKDFIITRKEVDSKLVDTCTFSVIAVSIFVVIIFLALIDVFFRDKSQLMRDIFIVMLFIPVISSFNIIQVALLQRDNKFKSLSLRSIASTFIAGSFALFFAYDGYGAWALVINHYCRIIIDTIILQVVVKYRPGFQFSSKYFKECYRFSLPLLLSEIMNYWSTRMMDFFVSVFHGASSLAILNISRKFTRLVQQLSLTSLRPVVLSYAAKSDNQSETFARFIGYITFVVAPVLMAIGIYAEFYITPIFGEQWKPAIKIVELLSTTALAQCLAWYFGLVLIKNNKTSLLFRLNLIFTAIFLTAGILSYKLEFAEYILVQVLLINILSIYKMTYLIYKRFIKLSDFKVLILPAIFSSFFFLVVAIMLRLYLDNVNFEISWVEVVVSVIFSIVSFLVASLVTVFLFRTFGQDFFELISKFLRKKAKKII